MDILVDYKMLHNGGEIVKSMLIRQEGIYSSKQIRKEKKSYAQILPNRRKLIPSGMA